MTRLAPRFIAVAILITVCGASISAQPETEAELRAKAEQGDVAWQEMVASSGDTGPQAAHRFVVLSIDRTTGELLWERTATEAIPQEGFHPQYGSGVLTNFDASPRTRP